MAPIKFAIFLCLISAVAATVATCLIPEMTVAGIWGIPVLGFALLVGAIFRVAVYYDPHEPQTEVAKRYAAYVAVTLLSYIAVFSCLEKMFQKGQHVAAFICTIFGIVSLLGSQAIAEYVWVAAQPPGESYPTSCKIRSFGVFIPSFLLLIASFAGDEGIAKVMKPIVIFIAYTNCVFFAAVYGGVFRPRIPFASNGTIAERFMTWLHSIADRLTYRLRSTVRPGNLLVTLEALCSVVVIIWLSTEVGCDIPQKYRLIPKAIFTIVVAISFYLGSHSDPRKPPEGVSLVTRALTLFAHFAISVYLEVYVEFFRKGDASRTFTIHLLSLTVLIFLRGTMILWSLLHEYENAHLCNSRLFVIIFHTSVYTVASLCYIAATIYNQPSDGFYAARSFTNSWYYITTLMIVAIITGKHRQVMRQNPLADADNNFFLV